jgi:hypothetical protein
MPRSKANKLTVRAWSSRTLDTEARTMTVVAATETPARVMDWSRGEFIDEVLLASGFKAAGKQVVLLDAHNRDSVEDVIGSATNFRVEGENVLADVRFAETEAGQRAMDLYRQGHLTDVSVGYSIEDMVELEDGKKKTIGGREFIGPMRLAKRWTIRELSAVPIGADPNAKARSEQETHPTAEARAEDEKIQEDRTMPEITTTTPNPGPAPTPPTPEIDVADLRKKAAAAEKARASEIRSRAAILGVSEMADQLIADDVTVEIAIKAMIDAVAERAKATKVQTKIEHVADDGQKFRAAATDALLLRAMPQARAHVKPADGADNLARLSFRSLMSECIRRVGSDPRFMSNQQMVSALLGRSGIVPQGTGDFTDVLRNVASKAVMVAQMGAPQTFRLWCSIGSLSDFKTSYRVRLNDAPALTLTPEGAEVRRAAFTDDGEPITLATYTAKTAITMQALVNDDLGVFNSIFAAYARRWAIQVNGLPYSVLSTNAVLADTGALFNTTAITTAGGHANQATVAADISSTSVSIMEALMMEQVGANSSKLNIMPAFLMCGSAKATNARIVLTSQTLPVAEMGSGVINPFNYIRPIIDTNISGNAWYLAADPMACPTVEVSFLDGNEALTVSEVASNDILGVEYLVHGSAVAKALDFRGLARNTGA